MKILALLLIISVLIGCGTTREPQTVYVPQRVEVPVYTAPSFDIPLKPLTPLDSLNWSSKDDHNVIGKAYVKSIRILNTHIDQLHNLLEGIKKGEDQ